MNLLLTNDDGWDAPGIAVLQTIAKQWGSVWTVAPLHPMSGISHQMTFERPMALTEKGSQSFSLDGTPADCVRIATTQLSVKFDWVLSGINNGGNLGSDIFVSGTVAAAREATLRGLRSIALSQHRSRFKLPYDWTRTGWMAETVLAQLLFAEEAWEPFTMMNVNFPDTYHQPRQPSDASHKQLPGSAFSSDFSSESRKNDSAYLTTRPASFQETHSEGTPLTPATTVADPRSISKADFLRELSIVTCPVDREPIPADFRLDDGGRYVYCSRYNDRAHTPGHDIETCFGGAIAISRLRLG